MPANDAGPAQWFALWTHSHCEQIVCDQLAAKRFETFLPTIATWSRRRGVQRWVHRPMFPSYLFASFDESNECVALTERRPSFLPPGCSYQPGAARSCNDSFMPSLK